MKQGGQGTALDERTKAAKPRNERPRKFRVVLLNDHYTTMEFVVAVLVGVFRKSGAEAERIMLQVHQNGRGTAGVYVKAIAEAKAEMVHRLAREHGYPLKCVVEPDGGGGSDEDGQ